MTSASIKRFDTKRYSNDNELELLSVLPAGGVGTQRVMLAGHANLQACGRQWTEKNNDYEQASTLTEAQGCRLELFIIILIWVAVKVHCTINN